ncbi:MAG: aminotransferase class V-fold PLP-dependent enzyme, partial [Solibacillus isronensis]
TENVPAIIAFAKAAELAGQSAQQRIGQYNGFKNILIEQFQQAGIDFHLNGHQMSVLPHVLNVTFPGTDVESFLINLDMAGVLVSSGSACTAGSIDPSHVLVAMYGQNAPELRSSIRFSFGLGLTDELVREAGKRTAEIVKRLTS